MLADGYEFILKRIIERALSSIEEAKEKPSEFENGRKLAYYEVVDIIKSELFVLDLDLQKFGLAIDLEKKFL